MRTTVVELIRDTALIVVPTFLGAAALAALPGKQEAGYDAILLHSIIGGGAVAGWLFRKNHGSPSLGNYVRDRAGPWRRFQLHSLALAVLVSLVFALTSFALAPATFHALRENPSAWLLVLFVPMGIGLNWVKILVSMMLGQWLYGRKQIRPS